MDRVARNRGLPAGRPRIASPAGLRRRLEPGSGRYWHSYTGSAMPVYEYRCERGHTFEVTQRMSDDPVTNCTTCEAPVQRVFHPVAVHFKGSGFYNTDYGKKNRGSSSSSESSGASEKSEKSEKSESKADSSSSSSSSSSSKSDD